MTCYHNRELAGDATVWYWGYVHNNGNIVIKQLALNRNADAVCDLCYCEYQENLLSKEHNAFVDILVDKPYITRAEVGYRLGVLKGIKNLTEEADDSSKKDRFELIDIE